MIYSAPLVEVVEVKGLEDDDGSTSGDFWAQKATDGRWATHDRLGADSIASWGLPSGT